MRRRWAIVAVALGVFALLSPAEGADLPAHQDLRERILSKIAAGEVDSVRAIVRNARTDVPDVVQALLLDRDRDLAQGRADSAAVRLERARTISLAYATALEDSSCLRMTEFREKLNASQRSVVVAGWSRYAEFLARIPQWGELKAEVPGLLDASARASDPYLEASVREYAGRCLVMTATSPEARKQFEKYREASERVGDRGGERYARILLARTYLSEDRLPEAMQRLEPILEPARQDEDWYAVLWTGSSLVTCHVFLGDSDAARPIVEECLAIAQREKMRKWEAEFLGHYATLLGVTGHYPEAIQRREEARRIQKELSLTVPELNSIVYLAWLYSVEERYTHAIELMREGLEIAERTGVLEMIAVLHLQIGGSYMRLGRPDEALRHYEAVLPTARAMGVPRHEANILHGIGSAHLGLGDPRAALPWFEQAWAKIRDLDLQLTAEEILPDLAQAYEETGQLELAQQRFEDALALSQKMGNLYLVGEAERGLGRVLAAEGQSERARELIASAVERGRTIGVPALLRDALVDAADLRIAVGEWAAADTLLVEALEIVESVRAEQAGEDIRLGFLTDKKSIFARRVGVLHRLGRDEEAFAVAERARARSLLDVLAVAANDVGGAVSPELREKERRLSVRLGEAQSALSEAVSAESWEAALVDSLHRAAEEAGREYRNVLDEISARDPAWGDLAGRRAPLGLDEVRARVLLPDQVLLEYVVSGDRCFAFLVGKDRFRAAALATSQDSLRVLADGLLTSIRAGNVDPAEARRLHEVLIAPVAADLPANARLLIIPDGPLFHVPFVLLKGDAGRLLEQHPIAYAPSASALDASIRRWHHDRPRSLLAVGNPTTFRADALLATARDAPDWRFGELPYSAEEVKRVAGHFRHARVVTGDDATEPAVKQAMADATHLHFATHGLLDENEPILSGLALAQSTGGGDDGVLQAHEILALSLNADLAVLSACNTALGRLADGEGVLGLSRAFLHAGARSLLLSLWEVADRSTMDLMDDFYAAHLDRGLPLDVALQHAQIDAAAAGRAPQEWAPFVILGSAEAPRTEGRAILNLALVAGAATLGLYVFARSRRRPASS